MVLSDHDANLSSVFPGKREVRYCFCGFDQMANTLLAVEALPSGQYVMVHMTRNFSTICFFFLHLKHFCTKTICQSIYIQ